MDDRIINLDFLEKIFPENYKVDQIKASSFKIATPFLDDFKANITLYLDATDPDGKISISDNKTIFGNLGLLHKKAVERMKTCVKQRFPENCHFASAEEKELVYEVNIDPNDRWFAEKLRFAVHNFIALLSKIYGFVEISSL